MRPCPICHYSEWEDGHLEIATTVDSAIAGTGVYVMTKKNKFIYRTNFLNPYTYLPQLSQHTNYPATNICSAYQTHCLM